MPTTDTSRTQLSGHDYEVDTKSPVRPEQSMFLTRLAEAVLQIPPFVQVCCFSATGIVVDGLLKCISRSGLQVLLPAYLPAGDVVQLTIANCRAVFAEVLYCVKRSGGYRVGMVFTHRHKPEIFVGDLVAIKSLDEPFTLTRGNVLDVGSTRLSIFCKTMLAAGAWVRVEANGWIVFGLVEAVVATSMLACCVDIQLEAAFPASSNLNSFQQGVLGKAQERDVVGSLESSVRSNDHHYCLDCR